jgi:hypothetical protein
MAETLTEVTITCTREGKLISREERQVPDDGTFDRGARLLFDLVHKDDAQDVTLIATLR